MEGVARGSKVGMVVLPGLILSLLAFSVAAASSATAPTQVRGHPKTYVLCDIHGNSTVLVMPRACTFFAGERSAGGVLVRRMKWKRWGGKTAKGRGTYYGNMGVRKSGAITLSGRRRCTGYGYIYSHFKMGSRDNGLRFNFNLPRCA